MASTQETQSQTPHAVCVPFPAQGHLNPMLQLAKLLNLEGFHITYVNTEYNHRRLLRTWGPEPLADRPTFRFRAISDGLPPTDGDSVQDFAALCSSLEKYILKPFKELIYGINQARDVPPVSCIVSDAAMFFTLDAAKEFGVPEVMLWTASGCGLLGYSKCQELVELGIIPFKDLDFTTNGDFNRVIDWLPGVINFRLKDMPGVIRITKSNDFIFYFVQKMVHHMEKASAILFNSFDALEHDVLEALPSNFPPLLTLGPLQLLIDSMTFNNNENINTISTSLLNTDPKCIEWLDSYAPKSVIYVNFGSITVMTHEQLLECAWGLANSKHPFLWIMRHDLVTKDSVGLPQEFFIETKDRGYITSWCNQEQVLAHPAIGGFVSHCGWNSTIETLINGVPIMCWPFYTEQYTNCWYSCNKWGIGMEIDTNVKRDEVEMQVKELMEGERGKDMRRNVMHWKRLARDATTSPDGSSHINFDKVILLPTRLLQT